MSDHDIVAPSPWVVRWGSLIEAGRCARRRLRGRASLEMVRRARISVVAVDRVPQAIPGAAFVQADLETGQGWPFRDKRFAGIVVTNYLHRPLFADLRASLAPDGVLIYETFMLGNERYGRPSNPSFLLRAGELLAAFADLTVLAFEQGPRRIAKNRSDTKTLCNRKGEGLNLGLLLC
jgi:SAM-dependent methyltransferase